MMMPGKVHSNRPNIINIIHIIRDIKQIINRTSIIDKIQQGQILTEDTNNKRDGIIETLENKR
jgi:hypothetical protein